MRLCISPEGDSVDQIPLEHLMGAGIVIDVTRQCTGNSDYLVSISDFQDWEKQNGRIPRQYRAAAHRLWQILSRSPKYLGPTNAALTQSPNFIFGTGSAGGSLVDWKPID